MKIRRLNILIETEDGRVLSGRIEPDDTVDFAFLATFCQLVVEKGHPKPVVHATERPVVRVRNKESTERATTEAKP